MRVVMERVKTNVFIVIFALLMISALVILPILSSSMNSGISKTVSERVKLVSELKALGKKDVEPPQAAKPVQGVPALVNEKLASVGQVPYRHPQARLHRVDLPERQRCRTAGLDVGSAALRDLPTA